MQGKCEYGDTCHYFHPEPCKFHAMGQCTRGDQCIFLHAGAVKAKGQAKGKSKEQSQPSYGEEQYRGNSPKATPAAEMTPRRTRRKKQKDQDEAEAQYALEELASAAAVE